MYRKIFLMSIRSMENRYFWRDLYIDVPCMRITYPISSNFSKKRFSFSIFLVSSFIQDFLFISFQKKNEIKKRNTLMEFKYLLFSKSIDLFDVKGFKRNFKW